MFDADTWEMISCGKVLSPILMYDVFVHLEDNNQTFGMGYLKNTECCCYKLPNNWY